MAGKIKLIDGTEYAGSAINDGGILWLYIANETLPDVCTDVVDPEKTETITVDDYGVTNVYEGFTHAFSLREVGGNTVIVGLEKGES